MRLKNILIIGLVIQLFVASCMCMGDNSEKAFEYYNKGCDYYNKGDYATAVEYFDKALEIDPNYVEAWNIKAIALLELERYDEAIKCYDKLIELNPKDTGYWCLKISLLEKLGRYEEAIECYDKATEINPNKATMWISEKGLALYLIGKKYEGLKCINKALEIDPNFDDAKLYKWLIEHDISPTSIVGQMLIGIYILYQANMKKQLNVMIKR